MCNGTANNGNCFGSASGGQQTATTVYNLPAGCQAEVTAEMKPRGASCANSGMDGGDLITLQGFGGSFSSAPNPTMGTGASNAAVAVSFTQTGGSFQISMSANRSDEIVTFSINLTGSCGPSCNGVLPITLKDFYAEPLENEILLKWNVSTEKNVAYYLLEKSSDGILFTPLNTISSLSGISGENNLSYFNYDYKPVKGINYYRLKNVDKDGNVCPHKVIAVNFKSAASSIIWLNQTSELIKIGYEKTPASKSVLIRDLTGRLIKEIELNAEAPAEKELPVSEFQKGIYLISGSDALDGFSQKLIIH